jgi:PKD repeat protein
MKKKTIYIVLLTYVLANYTNQVFAQKISLVFPENNAVVEDTIVEFIWDINNRYSSYRLQISNESEFNLLITDSVVINGNNVLIDIDINKKKFWRVIGILSIGGSDTSKIHELYVINFQCLNSLFFRFISSEGVVISGDSVSTWNDNGPNLFSISQSTPLKRPKLVNNQPILNGHPYILFDGTDDYLKSTAFDLPMPYNYFTVFKTKKATGDVFDGGISAKHLLRLGLNKYAYYSGGAYNYSTTLIDSTKFIIHNIQVNQDSAELYINNSFEFKKLGGNNSSLGLTIGAIAHGGGNFSNILIPEIIAFSDTVSDSLRTLIHDYLHYKYAPPVNLGANIYATNYCDTVLYAGKRFTDYTWKDGSSSDSLVVNKTGWYSVTVTDIFGFTSTDSVYVHFPEINQITSDTICQGDLKMWTTNLDTTNFNFEWSNGATDSLINISLQDDYWVKVTDAYGCSEYSDTITIVVDSFPTQTTLGLDKTICQYANLGLEADNGGVNYLWSTNDTTIQTMVDTAGVYWVEVENNMGCIARDTINITVNGIAPTVNFDVIGLCENAPTLLNNTSFTTDGSNMVGWHWDFGNGDTSNVEDAQTVFTAGNYNVVLVVETDSGCTNKYQKQITIHQEPTAGFFPANGLMCSNQKSMFTNNSFSSDGVINTWYWDFGVVGTADTSSLENGNYAFPNSGSFNVQLISTTEYGCKDTVGQFVSVKQTPSASFIIQDSCVNSSVGFLNTSSGNLFSTFWNFGDFNSSSLNSPSHAYSSAGLFNVQLIIKDLNGCWDTLLTPITINDKPMANFVSDDFCVLTNSQLFDSSITNAGVVTQWDWKVLNTGYNSNIQNPQFLFTQVDTGIYNLKLKVENSFGCTDSVIKTIAVHPLPVPNFTFSPEIGLPPLDVIFTNSSIGGNTYEWDFGDGNTSTNYNPIYTYTDSNTFEIKLTTTSLYGCKDSVINIIQVINPIVDVAVKNVTYELLPNSNLMRVTAQLANVGVVAVQALDLMLYNSTTGKVLEKWEGNILPNTQELVELSSIIEVPAGEIPDVICVEALNPNDAIDVDMSNNEFCKSLLKFELVNIYPNPTSNELNIELIFPESGLFEMTLYNEIGKQVSILYNGIAIKGLNRHKFLLGTYSNGIYFIEIKFNGETIRKKIMIN